jgi:hypothetical protein
MQRRKAMSLSAFLLASPLVAKALAQAPVQAQNDKGGSQASPPPTADQSAASQELERMRSLIMQMQNNLASLPSGYSATKHQFELEIDMWRMLLNHIERGSGVHNGPPS